MGSPTLNKSAEVPCCRDRTPPAALRGRQSGAADTGESRTTRRVREPSDSCCRALDKLLGSFPHVVESLLVVATEATPERRSLVLPEVFEALSVRGGGFNRDSSTSERLRVGHGVKVEGWSGDVRWKCGSGRGTPPAVGGMVDGGLNLRVQDCTRKQLSVVFRPRMVAPKLGLIWIRSDEPETPTINL